MNMDAETFFRKQFEQQDLDPVQCAINVIAAARVVNLLALSFPEKEGYDIVPTKAIMELRSALIEYMAVTKQGAFAEEDNILGVLSEPLSNLSPENLHRMADLSDTPGQEDSDE